MTSPSPTEQLEDRLRATLHARAGDVEPTPHLWDRLDQRIHRRRWQVLAGWTLGTAAAVLAAVVVLPQVVAPRQGVVVDQPTGLGTDAPLVPTAAAYVATDGRVLELRAATDGELLDRVTPYPSPEFEGAIVAVAVRPGSTPDDLTLAFTVAVEGVHEVRWLRWAPGGDPRIGQLWTGGTDTAGAGPPAPVWSPDGTHLAVLIDGGLRTVDWSGQGPGSGDADFGAPPLEAAGPQRLEAWAWDAVDGPAAQGTLYVSDGAGDVHGLAVERQADGALALPADGGPVEVAGALDVAPTGDPGSLRVLFLGDDGVLRLAHTRDGALVAELPLPVLEGIAPQTVELDAWGGSALLGDGERLWLVDDGLRELPPSQVAALLPTPP